MAENPIQGFQTDTGVEQYDYNALANKPTLITQTEIDAAITTANRYTDEQIAKIDTTPTVQIELDTSLSVQGKAADAKAVGDALGEKLGTTELDSAINTALAQAKASGEFDGKDGKDGKDGTNGTNGTDGKDYILTDADKAEIAEMAAELVDIPESGGGSVDLTGYATEQWVQTNYQPKGNYLTAVPEGYAKTEDIPTDSHINSLIDAKLAQFTNVAEVGA